MPIASPAARLAMPPDVAAQLRSQLKLVTGDIANACGELER